jgi:hypothetical protein
VLLFVSTADAHPHASIYITPVGTQPGQVVTLTGVRFWGTVGNATIEWADGTPIGQAAVDANGNWTYSFVLPQGVDAGWRLTALAYDSSGLPIQNPADPVAVTGPDAPGPPPAPAPPAPSASVAPPVTTRTAITPNRASNAPQLGTQGIAGRPKAWLGKRSARHPVATVPHRGFASHSGNQSGRGVTPAKASRPHSAPVAVALARTATAGQLASRPVTAPGHTLSQPRTTVNAWPRTPPGTRISSPLAQTRLLLPGSARRPSLRPDLRNPFPWTSIALVLLPVLLAAAWFSARMRRHRPGPRAPVDPPEPLARPPVVSVLETDEPDPDQVDDLIEAELQALLATGSVGDRTPAGATTKVHA